VSDLPADAWVPVPVRFRHVVPGDVFVGRDGALWHIRATGVLGRNIVSADQGENNRATPVDLDDVVQVLVPVGEREAVELTREQLGAQLVERRTA
jgi:hypothetical protein